MTLAIVTTVTESYIPLARVLMASAARLHPDAKRFVVVLDGGDSEIEGAVVLRPKDLIPDNLELTIQQSMYKPIEFATALKAKLLTFALKSSDQAVFLDPDMRLFQPMTAALEALERGSGTLVTPHRVTAPSFADRTLFEWALKAYGALNTGFVAATHASLPMLQWWDSRLSRDCLDLLDGYEWVDQKMMDLAPSYFDLDIFKDPAYNVGWWNLEERPLHRENGTWFAGDKPLVLMHYSGVRPRGEQRQYPYLVHSPLNSVTRDATHLAVIEQIETEYVSDLEAAGYAQYHRLPYGLAITAGGRTLSDADRRGYRALVLAAELEGQQPPHPDAIAWGPAARAARAVRLLKLPRAARIDAQKAWKLSKSLVGRG